MNAPQEGLNRAADLIEFAQAQESNEPMEICFAAASVLFGAALGMGSEEMEKQKEFAKGFLTAARNASILYRKCDGDVKKFLKEPVNKLKPTLVSDSPEPDPEDVPVCVAVSESVPEIKLPEGKVVPIIETIPEVVVEIAPKPAPEVDAEPLPEEKS